MSMDATRTPSPTCIGLMPPPGWLRPAASRLPGWLPPRSSCDRVFSKTTRLALKPAVLTLAMLSPTTPIIIWCARRPETPANIDRIMAFGPPRAPDARRCGPSVVRKLAAVLAVTERELLLQDRFPRAWTGGDRPGDSSGAGRALGGVRRVLLGIGGFLAGLGRGRRRGGGARRRGLSRWRL